MLDFVYAKPMQEGGYDESLVEAIVEPTQQPAAASVFCSILSSPPPDQSFDDMLDKVRMARVPCMLAYGREDPWVIPLWGLKAARRLQPAELGSSGTCHYYEITPVGHCPQDEAPEAVALLIQNFAEYAAGRLDKMPDAQSLNEKLSTGACAARIVFHPKPEPRTPIEALDTIVYNLATRGQAK